MSVSAYLAFTIAMFFLALSPGPGLAAVLSRTLAYGKAAGFRTVAGMVPVDILFLALAMAGLSAVATLMGPFFMIVKYAAAAYLIWLGIKAWRSAGAPVEVASQDARGAWKDVGIGALVTLGNPKAIMFYSALLPTFFDVSKMDLTAFLITSLLIAGVLFLVYGGYIALADKSRGLFQSFKAKRLLDKGIGAMLIGSGVLVTTR